MLKALLVLFASVDAKKKRPPPSESLDVNDRFLAIERELYCIGCKAMVNVLQKELGRSRSESDVILKMSDICKPS